MEELNSARHRHSQAKCQLVQTSYIKRVKLFLFLPARATIHLRRPWTSAFFRLASGTVGFSPRLKNAGHVITFLRRCGLQNTDHVMPFWPLKVDSSRLCQSPEEGKMSFLQDLIDACRCLRLSGQLRGLV